MTVVENVSLLTSNSAVWIFRRLFRVGGRLRCAAILQDANERLAGLVRLTVGVVERNWLVLAGELSRARRLVVHLGCLLLRPDDALVGFSLDALLVLTICAVDFDDAADDDDDEERD